MDAVVLSKSDLEHSGNSYDFQGYLHGATHVSFLWVDMPPGDGPRLHKHPYEEVFIILEGRSTFTVGATTLEAEAGQIVIAPPNTPHKFINTGSGPLRQIDIHTSDRFITEWLED
ncbi:MAG TPA: cupin domain-containing protein [Ktedonobacterales bacterium]